MAAAVILLTFGCWVSWEDGRSMVIPDRAVGGALGLLLLGTLTGVLVPIEALLGFLLALVQMGLVYGIFRGRGMGLGDVKYACVLGGLLGPAAWVGALFCAALGALVCAGAGRVFRGESLKGRIPFAPYLTAGGLGAALVDMRGVGRLDGLDGLGAVGEGMPGGVFDVFG